MATTTPDKLKIGIIGTGSISMLHLWAISQAAEKVKLTAACDIREDAVHQFAKSAGLDRVYTDAVTMLKEADIDAVDICASHQWHKELAIASAEAGKHILLEKPMAISMHECRDILAAADKAGVTLMIGQQLRYNPNYIAVQRLIQEGELGQVWGLRTDSWLPVIMSRSINNNQFAQNELLKWRIDKNRSGGGSLIWNAIHFIDLFRYFIGNAKRVFAKCWTDHPIFSGGAEDRVMATIEFENGAVGHISNSWTTRAPWQFQFMILGTEGSIYTPVNPSATSIEQHEAPAVVSCPKYDIGEAGSGGRVSEPFVPIELPEGLFSNNPYVNEFAHFTDCCRNGKEPISSGRDNLHTMKTVFGIYEASRRGEMVDLNEL